MKRKVMTVDEARAAGQVDVDVARLFHLTHTGPHAGTPFCGVDKAQLLEAGTARFAHVPYSNADTFLARPDICPDCRRIWFRR